MSATNDGGSAFPRPMGERANTNQYNHAQTGMTLRDWFAGQALVALPHIGCGCDLGNDELAAASYQIADAMLAEREKGGDK